MSRKFRATEVSGTFNVDGRGHGQYMHSNYLCVNCNAVSRFGNHYPDCKKHEAYVIPATAEVPRKSASKRIWDIFKKQFVFAKPIGYWVRFSDSWWYEKTKNTI